MAKDAYYFSHDSNSKDDPKCVLLIEQLGLEGYGIFWVLVETLREQPQYKYPLALIPAIARRYNTTSEKAKTVVMNYGLFTITDDEMFLSESLIERMQHLENKREKASLAGKASAQKRQQLLNERSTDVQQTFNDRSTSKVNKSKVNKIKEKEIIEYYRSFDHLKISFEEFEKLENLGYTKNEIDNVLDSIQNYKKNVSYKSLFLTAKKWLENDKNKSNENFGNNKKGQSTVDAVNQFAIEHLSSKPSEVPDWLK